MDTKIKEFLKESNAIEDVWNKESLFDAQCAWDYLIQQKELSINVILETHRILSLHDKMLDPSQKGHFRRIPIYIGYWEGMYWQYIPVFMEEWCCKANEDTRWKDIQISHIAYEHCHPFCDFNGRTGRIFLNWARLKNGMKIKVFKEKDRFKYYKMFEGL